MKISLDDSRPIFLQIAESIEDDIVEGKLREGDQIPSTNQFASFYQINPATAAKGINLLVEVHYQMLWRPSKRFQWTDQVVDEVVSILCKTDANDSFLKMI